MAASKAWLAGRLLEKSTATEHATSSSSTATEHATFSSSTATEHATSYASASVSSDGVHLAENFAKWQPPAPGKLRGKWRNIGEIITCCTDDMRWKFLQHVAQEHPVMTLAGLKWHWILQQVWESAMKESVRISGVRRPADWHQEMNVETWQKILCACGLDTVEGLKDYVYFWCVHDRLVLKWMEGEVKCNKPTADIGGWLADYCNTAFLVLSKQAKSNTMYRVVSNDLYRGLADLIGPWGFSAERAGDVWEQLCWHAFEHDRGAFVLSVIWNTTNRCLDASAAAGKDTALHAKLLQSTGASAKSAPPLRSATAKSIPPWRRATAAGRSVKSELDIAEEDLERSRLEKSTATEHATSSSSTATEHATSSSRPDPAASTNEISFFLGSNEDRFLLGDNDLHKIAALLQWMAHDFVKTSNISTDDIQEAALEAILKQHDAGTNLNTAAIAKLVELIDIMMLHKDGSPKDAHKTLAFMRRVARVREDVRATRATMLQSVSNATEPSELEKDEVSLCYQRFGRILLTEDLLPHQKQDKKYHLRNKFENDMTLSSFQRSFIDNMLRKSLGDKRVAYRIWQHGMPSIVDTPPVIRRRVDHEEHYMGMLQSSLNECLQWYSCLANEIVIHKTQEGFDAQLSASSLDKHERQEHQTRRESLQKAQATLRRGAALAKQRDDGKRSYDDMDDDEKKILEDFDTGMSNIAMQHFTTPRMKSFRCKLESNATEHAA